MNHSATSATTGNPVACQLNCGKPWSVIIPVCDLTLELRDMALKAGQQNLIALCNGCYRMALRSGGMIMGYRHSNGRVVQYVKETLI